MFVLKKLARVTLKKPRLLGLIVIAFIERALTRKKIAFLKA